MRDATAELRTALPPPADSRAARVTSLDKVFQRETSAAADASYDHKVRAFYEAHPLLSFTLELPHEKPDAPPAPLVAEPCRALALAADSLRALAPRALAPRPRPRAGTACLVPCDKKGP